MQTVNFDIGQLLKKIKAGHFLIPQFQRDFTWKDGQTRLLIDSIARNYPVGSLLILGKNESIPLKSRKLDAIYPPRLYNGEENYEFDEATTESYYVLDGQQRLTSIARVFLDSHPRKSYYFDLARMLNDFNSEDPSWITHYTRSKKNLERKNNNKLIRTDISMDQEKCDAFIPEYLEDSGDFPEFKNDRFKARQYAAKIRGIFETIRKFTIPFVVLDSDAPLESVCRVFETINSTGTRLTTFDLAVARYYPKPDLKELFDSSKEQFPIIDDYEIDGERIMQILSLYNSHSIGKFPEATRSEVLSLNPEFILEKWNLAVTCLIETCQWLNGLGATPITKPPHGIFVSVATTLMCFPGSLQKNPEFSQVLRRWYFCTTLTNNPSPANNYKVGSDFRSFCEFLSKKKPITYPSVFFTNQDIRNITHVSDSKYRAIQVLMRTTIKTDLFTGNSLTDELEDHHIFPFSLKQSGINKNFLNSIANKVIVSKSSNRVIGNKNPEKYLGELADRSKIEGNSSDFDRRLRDCYIPYSSLNKEFKKVLSIENFSQFLDDRSNCLIERIKEVVGNAWKDPQGEYSPDD